MVHQWFLICGFCTNAITMMARKHRSSFTSWIPLHQQCTIHINVEHVNVEQCKFANCNRNAAVQLLTVVMPIALNAVMREV